MPLPHRRKSQRARRLHPGLWIVFAGPWVVIFATDTILDIRFEAQCKQYRQTMALIRPEIQRVTGPLADWQRPLWRLPLWRSRARPFIQTPFLSRLACLVQDSLMQYERKLSLAKVEELINDGRPLPTRNLTREARRDCTGSDEYEVATYVSPTSGIELDLYFVNGSYRHHHLVKPNLNRPQPVAWWRELQRQGAAIPRNTKYAWAFILLALAFVPRFRCFGAELMLMITVNSLLSHLPSPLNPHYWNNFLKRDQIHWDLVMISASLAVLSWAYFSQVAKSRIRCPICDYNLTGNTSGTCPECGSRIPIEVIERIALGRANAGLTKGASI